MVWTSASTLAAHSTCSGEQWADLSPGDDVFPCLEWTLIERQSITCLGTTSGKVMTAGSLSLSVIAVVSAEICFVCFSDSDSRIWYAIFGLSSAVEITIGPETKLSEVVASGSFDAT